jgi:hypothetical protein
MGDLVGPFEPWLYATSYHVMSYLILATIYDCGVLWYCFVPDCYAFWLIAIFLQLIFNGSQQKVELFSLEC